MDTETRTRLLAEARTWIGTPYHPDARVKGVGVDCGHFVHEVFGQFIGPLPSMPRGYAEDWGLHKPNPLYLDYIRSYPNAVEVDSFVTGGVALFQIGASFAHGTIMTERGTFIHAWGRRNRGSVRESPRNFFGRKAVMFFDVRLPCSQ